MLVFRRPEPEEAAAMASLHVRCWVEAYTPIVPAGVSSRFEVEPMIPAWQERLPNQTRFIIAAFDESQPVAFINQGPRDDEAQIQADVHIMALYVVKAYHRRGLGRTLMALGARDCLAKGGTALSLGVLSENLQARHFYDALGGRVIKAGLFSWNGHDLPIVDYVFEDLPRLAAWA
jgi:GNAT superfamily N-acetyltransferase